MAETPLADLRAELSRKAMDTLHEHVHRHSEGALSDRELILITQAVYDTVSGLVPWDVAGVLYQVRKELSK